MELHPPARLMGLPGEMTQSAIQPPRPLWPSFSSRREVAANAANYGNTGLSRPCYVSALPCISVSTQIDLIMSSGSGLLWLKMFEGGEKL